MILFDDIMLFLCLDAKETKVKGVKNFIAKTTKNCATSPKLTTPLTENFASFLMAEFKHGFGLTLRFSCFPIKCFKCPEADRNSLILTHLF